MVISCRWVLFPPCFHCLFLYGDKLARISMFRHYTATHLGLPHPQCYLCKKRPPTISNVVYWGEGIKWLALWCVYPRLSSPSSGMPLSAAIRVDSLGSWFSASWHVVLTFCVTPHGAPWAFSIFITWLRWGSMSKLTDQLHRCFENYFVLVQGILCAHRACPKTSCWDNAYSE